jgi:hypothetical protein
VGSASLDGVALSALGLENLSTLVDVSHFDVLVLDCDVAQPVTTQAQATKTAIFRIFQNPTRLCKRMP